jgi:aspartokinase
MKVMKFGGSSLKSGEGIKRVCKIISSDTELKVVVVSALSGVTEELIQVMSHLPKEDEIEAFIKGMEDRHIALLNER